MTLGTVFMQGG